DGITEAAATNDDAFGMERLSALLAEGSRMSLCELVRRIDSRVTDFAAGLPQGDDQTLLLVRRDPLPA
ncbi:MAG: SpoIIE family protein phosphatase, partial [Thermoanaerobaculia bacterium]